MQARLFPVFNGIDCGALYFRREFGSLINVM